MTRDDDRIPVRLAPIGAENSAVAGASPGTLVLRDARVPGETATGVQVVDFGAAETLAAASVIGHAPTGQAGGCACCVGRPKLGTALGRLFAARARGEVAFFAAVLAVSDASGLAAARAALAADPFLRARYRLDEAPGPADGTVAR